MDPLKQKFRDKALGLAKELKALRKANADVKVGEVNIAQLFGGMRGVKSMIWETSHLDSIDGIKFRGYTIPELKELLPKAEGGKEPLPEGLFWLMLVGDIPTNEEVKWLADQWRTRSNVPAHTFKVLDQLPIDAHPMMQFTIAIASMQSESVFVKRYAEGMHKAEYWDATYEDSMNLIARLPRVAAYIYRRSYHNGNHISPDFTLDWAANFAHMLGVNDTPDFKSLIRLYLTIHADHEGGNASAHATHLVGSTLSDAYLSLSGGMNALAGPLHGLANQEVVKFILNMIDALGTSKPTEAQIADYVNSILASGRVIPGFGHAVLRRPDPRYTAQQEFAKEYIKDSDIVEIVKKMFIVVPEALKALGKVKNPWPNVDAHSGALLIHFGMKEHSFYTVLFGVSRALGVLSSLCWSRALGMAIERPKSVTSKWVKEFLKETTVASKN